MIRASAALAATALLLTGCSAEPTLPPGLTPAEVKALIDQQNARWWNSMFPDEERPVIDPVSYADFNEQWPLIEQCLEEAEIPGVVYTSGNLRLDPSVPDAGIAFDRQNYICSMTYPERVDYDAPEERGYYSEEQLGYIYDYLVARTMPCLNLLGYRLAAPPERDAFVDSFYINGYWLPYYQTNPPIDSEREWERMKVECPPPPIGNWYF